MLISLGKLCDYHISSDSSCLVYSNFYATFSFQLVTSGLTEVTSIAVDWIGRNIYWSDQQLRQIAVASINGSARAVLFKDNDFLPGVIVLDPRSGSVSG